MSYCTRFECEVYEKTEDGRFIEPEDFDWEDVHERVPNKYDQSWADFFEDKEYWYEYKDDMIKLSLEFKDLYFNLSGYGEESGDVWKKVFHNGKVIASWTLQATEPDFEELLQDHRCEEGAE